MSNEIGQFKIIRSKRRTIALHITPDASLIVRAPKSISFDEIHKAVQSKLPWILKKQRFVRQTCTPSVKKQYTQGEPHLYLGQSYPLSIVKGTAVPLVFYGERFLLAEKYLPHAERVFLWWYKQQAVNIISQRLKLYSAPDLKYTSVKITNGRKQIGSCNSKGRLTFSCRLMMTPIHIIDYVVVHELMHLRQPNHSKKFWHLVSLLLPDYKQSKLWLKTHSAYFNLS